MASSTVKDRVISDADLCQWLRLHSSGAYRTSATAAGRIEELLALALTDQELMLELEADRAKLKKDLHNMRVSRDKHKGRVEK